MIIKKKLSVSNISTLYSFRSLSLSSDAFFGFCDFLFFDDRIVENLDDDVNSFVEIQSFNSGVFAELKPSFLALIRRPFFPLPLSISVQLPNTFERDEEMKR